METLRGRRSAPVLALAILVGAWPRTAAAQLLEPEFQVNDYTTNDQALVRLGADEAGNFVAVWEGHMQDGSEGGVFARQFDADGQPLGGEFQVNTYTTWYQTVPDVAVNESGDFVVVWESYRQDGSGRGVFGQRYDSAGNPMGGEFQVNTVTTDDQVGAAVALRSDGEFVVVWEDNSPSGWDAEIQGQRYDSAGNPVGGEFQVNSSTTSRQSGPQIGMDAAGNFVVVWTSYGQDGDAFGVFGQRFDAAGDPAGPEFQANTYTTSLQLWPAVAVSSAGDFTVVWGSWGQDGSSFGIFGQQFDAAGVPVGSEFPVNRYTTNDQVAPVVALTERGEFVVVWNSYGQDGSRFGVFGQELGAGGNPVGDPFQVNTHTPLNQFGAAVVPLGQHEFLVAWADDSGRDGSGSGVFARKGRLLLLFRDGFEAGHVCGWTLAVTHAGPSPCS